MAEVNVSLEMPKYRCHKEVWALKIAAVTGEAPPGIDGTGFHYLIPEDDRYGPIPVTDKYFYKHEPKAGGYYVVYADGYQSFSPAEAFEAGYTQIN